MVSSSFKPAVNRVIEPISRAAVRLGVTPDMVTITGTIGSIASSIYLIPQGELFLAEYPLLIVPSKTKMVKQLFPYPNFGSFPVHLARMRPEQMC